MVNGAISPARNSREAAARWCDAAATASWDSRVMDSLALCSSVEAPMERCSAASVRPSYSRVSIISIAPYLAPARARCTCGARDMDSWPMASTTSTSPLAIRRSPATTASAPERHTALTAMAGTFSGTPAPTADWRAGFWPAPPCSTSSALHRCLGGVGSQRGSRHGSQGPVEFHERGAGVAYDLDGHSYWSSWMSTAKGAAVIS